MSCTREIFPEPHLLVPEPLVYSFLETLEDGPVADADGNQTYGDPSVVAHSLDDPLPLIKPLREWNASQVHQLH